MSTRCQVQVVQEGMGGCTAAGMQRSGIPEIHHRAYGRYRSSAVRCGSGGVSQRYGQCFYYHGPESSKSPVTWVTD